MVGEVVGIRKIQGVLFYEVINLMNEESFLLFSNGNLTYSKDTYQHSYDTNYYYKPLFIGYQYVFFLQKFTDVSDFTNSQTVYQLSRTRFDNDNYNRYYSVFNHLENTTILYNYDNIHYQTSLSDFVKGFLFSEISNVDIYYQSDIGYDLIDNYLTLKNLVISKFGMGGKDD